VTLNRNVTRPPRVTISPWAKLVRPVVPKINEMPSAASAMISEKCRPEYSRSAKRSNDEPPPESFVPGWLPPMVVPAAPSGNSTLRACPSATVGVRLGRLLVRPTPEGNDVRSRSTR
jgi:hypothetical protein